MIGSRIKKKCTKALITALTSQMNGGKAMTPGLSSVVTGHCFRCSVPVRLASKC